MRALRIGEVATPGLAVALLLGWDLTAAVVLAGVTYVTSSGITAKVLADLDWIGNRETPVVLSLLVLEDLTMALYLPIVTALLAGVGLLGGSITVAVALTMVSGVLLVALRFGRAVEAFVTSPSEEVLLLKVLGLTLLVAGLAQRLQVSAAVGAFLVGITLSGPLAHTESPRRVRRLHLLRRMELWDERVSTRRSCGSERYGWSSRSRLTIRRSGRRSPRSHRSWGSGRAETLRKWVRRAESDDGRRPGLSSEEHTEIKRLKRELAELRRANEILKAASVLFAAELDRPQTRS